MGLLLSVLVACVGVAELIAFYAHVRRSLARSNTEDSDLETIVLNYKSQLANKYRRILTTIYEEDRVETNYSLSTSPGIIFNSSATHSVTKETKFPKGTSTDGELVETQGQKSTSLYKQSKEQGVVSSSSKFNDPIVIGARDIQACSSLSGHETRPEISGSDPIQALYQQSKDQGVVSSSSKFNDPIAIGAHDIQACSLLSGHEARPEICESDPIQALYQQSKDQGVVSSSSKFNDPVVIGAHDIQACSSLSGHETRPEICESDPIQALYQQSEDQGVVSSSSKFNDPVLIGAHDIQGCSSLSEHETRPEISESDSYQQSKDQRVVSSSSSFNDPIVIGARDIQACSSLSGHETRPEISESDPIQALHQQSKDQGVISSSSKFNDPIAIGAHDIQACSLLSGREARPEICESDPIQALRQQSKDQGVVSSSSKFNDPVVIGAHDIQACSSLSGHETRPEICESDPIQALYQQSEDQGVVSSSSKFNDPVLIGAHDIQGCSSLSEHETRPEISESDSYQQSKDQRVVSSSSSFNDPIVIGARDIQACSSLSGHETRPEISESDPIQALHQQSKDQGVISSSSKFNDPIAIGAHDIQACSLLSGREARPEICESDPIQALRQQSKDQGVVSSSSKFNDPVVIGARDIQACSSLSEHETHPELYESDPIQALYQQSKDQGVVSSSSKLNDPVVIGAHDIQGCSSLSEHETRPEISESDSYQQSKDQRVVSSSSSFNDPIVIGARDIQGCSSLSGHETRPEICKSDPIQALYQQSKDQGVISSSSKFNDPIAIGAHDIQACSLLSGREARPEICESDPIQALCQQSKDQGVVSSSSKFNDPVLIGAHDIQGCSSLSGRETRPEIYESDPIEALCQQLKDQGVVASPSKFNDPILIGARDIQGCSSLIGHQSRPIQRVGTTELQTLDEQRENLVQKTPFSSSEASCSETHSAFIPLEVVGVAITSQQFAKISTDMPEEISNWQSCSKATLQYASALTSFPGAGESWSIQPKTKSKPQSPIQLHQMKTTETTQEESTLPQSAATILQYDHNESNSLNDFQTERNLDGSEEAFPSQPRRKRSKSFSSMNEVILIGNALRKAVSATQLVPLDYWTQSPSPFERLLREESKPNYPNWSNATSDDAVKQFQLVNWFDDDSFKNSLDGVNEGRKREFRRKQKSRSGFKANEMGMVSAVDRNAQASEDGPTTTRNKSLVEIRESEANPVQGSSTGSASTKPEPFWVNRTYDGTGLK